MADIRKYLMDRKKRTAMVTAPTAANVAMPRPAVRVPSQSSGIGVPSVDRSVLQQAIDAARQERQMAAGMRPAVSRMARPMLRRGM